MTTTYTSARFWKCALQVNPESYSQTYRGQGHGLSGEDFLSALLESCQKAGIEIVGLADHGSVQDVDAIRDYLQPHGIVVFPGFEIATSEKVHWVCLFPEDTTTEQLNRYLGSLKLTDPEEGVRPSKLGGENFLQQVDELGGFCYAAHATNDNGVLKQKANHLWKDAHLKAAQIPGSLEDLPSEFKQRIKNQDPAYKREAAIALINAMDVAKPEDLANPSASCFIKMTRPTFSSFLTAFKDPDSRVRRYEQMEVKHYSCIKNMRISGGYLDGLEIDFSDHLNAAIGGRGTGKTTLLECLRYALDYDHKGLEARKQGDQIVKENLGKSAGRVELEVVSAANNMQRYQIIRRYGEPPRVKDSDGNESTLHPSDLLPNIEIYGQNEIFELAKDESSQVRIIERFLPTEAKQQSLLMALKKRLSDNATRYQQALTKQDELEQELAQLPKLTEQASQFKSLGIEEKLKQVPLLEKERQLKPRIDDEVQRLDEAAQNLEESLPDLVFLSDKILESLPHADLLRHGRSVLEELRQSAKQSLEQLQNATKIAREKLYVVDGELKSALETAEQALEKEFSTLPDVAGKRGSEIGRTYQRLLREIERIQPKEARLQTARNLVQELGQERRNLLGELSDVRSQRTDALQTAAKRLSKRLRGKLRILVVPNGNRKSLKDYLCRLPGISEKKAAWVNSADNLTIPALVDTIRKGEDVLREAGWGITPGIAGTLARLTPAQIMELESIDVEDQVDLQLNVSYDVEIYKSLGQLSTGQQCTAILHLLLLDNSDPLIMDQPEDNLDNAFIAERIVQELRDAKTERQFLFATHNANIPVFGDAEWIGIFTATGDHGEMGKSAQGSIDIPEIRDQVARILEGGKAAFVQRKEKYGY
ncbi:MAG: AAA family ATPase [Candidatus Thiodiazotropha lotti]|nr:AAA family ATPase [Candidatus Thiodiazotropha lotti]